MPALHLEAGRIYKTRDGRQAGPLVVMDEPTKNAFRGYVTGDLRERVWKSDGRHEFGETNLDLVAEADEPKKDLALDDRLAAAAERIATALEIIAERLKPADHPASALEPSLAEDIVQPDADGWIEWHGGECPFPVGTMVDTRDRDGTKNIGYRLDDSFGVSGRMYWNHSVHGTGAHNDVVAYRVVTK